MLLILVGISVGIVAVIGALGLGRSAVRHVTRSDTPEDFVFLSEALLDPIRAEGESVIQLSDAEADIKLKRLRNDSASLVARCNKLEPSAQGIVDLFQNAETLAQNAPSFSKIFFGVSEAALGGYTGQKDHVGTGGQKALSETEKLVNAMNGLKELLHQRHVLAVEFADIASQFSGPGTNAALLNVSFAEHVPGLLWGIETREVLTLTNTSGRDLHNCVISVRLSNAEGKSYLNVYYRKSWLKDEKLVTRYSDQSYPRNTVDAINRVEIILKTSEFTSAPVVLTKPQIAWPEAE